MKLRCLLEISPECKTPQSIFCVVRRDSKNGKTQILPDKVVDSVILVEGPSEPAFEALKYITYSVPACNPSNLCP